jgi:hypothetical protein
MWDDIPAGLTEFAVRALKDVEDRNRRVKVVAGLVIAQYLHINISQSKDPFVDRKEPDHREGNGGISSILTIKISLIGEMIFELRNSHGFMEFADG